MYIITEVPGNSRAFTINEALLDCFSLEREDFSVTPLFGEKKPYEADEKEGLPHQELTYLSSNWKEKFTFSLMGPEDELLKQRLRLGNIMHEVLAGVEITADLPEAIEKVRQQYHAEAMNFEAIGKELEQLLARPELALFFNEDAGHFTEVSLLTEDQELIRPDRIVEKDEMLYILDYKTGDPSDLHYTQLSKYAQTLSAISEKEVKAYLLYLEKGELKQVA